MDEQPPGLPRTPWPLIEICESSLVRELSAGPSVVANRDRFRRNTGTHMGGHRRWPAERSRRGRRRARSGAWSMRVSNDLDTLTELLDRVDAGDDVSWAVDLIGCETALLRAVLMAAGHQGDLRSRADGQDDDGCVRR